MIFVVKLYRKRESWRGGVLRNLKWLLEGDRRFIRGICGMS